MSQPEKNKERHQQRQQRLKEKVDERVDSAQEEKGICIVITGNGKGKSTSAFGMVARCVGHGYKAAVAQFIKGTWECGERTLLEQHGVPFVVMATGFTWDTQDRISDMAAASEAWQQVKPMLEDDSIHLVVLDELTYMLQYDYLNTDEVISAIENRPVEQSVVITGRGAHRRLLDIADTVSEVKNVKHAFESGIKARKGVDW